MKARSKTLGTFSVLQWSDSPRAPYLFAQHAFGESLVGSGAAIACVMQELEP